MANTTNTIPKEKNPTKAMQFAAILAVLNGESIQNAQGYKPMTVDTLKAFINNEVALLAKKNSGEKSAEKAKEKAADIAAKQEDIFAFLSQQTEAVNYMTIIRGVGSLADYSPQGVVPIVRGMVDDGRVKKEMVKGKAMFSVA